MNSFQLNWEGYRRCNSGDIHRNTAGNHKHRRKSEFLHLIRKKVGFSAFFSGENVGQEGWAEGLAGG